MVELRTVIVGTSWKGEVALLAVGRLAKGDVLELRREPENEKDPGAVAVYYGGKHIGFIPKHSNRDVGAALDAGLPVTAEVTLAAIMDGGQIARSGLPHIVVKWEEEK